MSLGAWEQIKSSKRFYVNTYRKLIRLLLFSVTLNIVLFLVVAHIYLNRPTPAFYSTSGSTPPVLLTPRDTPNESSTPLLASDTESVKETKAVPQ